MSKNVFICSNAGAAQKKDALLKCVEEFAATMDEASQKVLEATEGRKALTLSMGINLSNALESIIMSMRGITYHAITDLPCKADVSEVVFAAAEVFREAEDLKTTLDELLDERMKDSDSVLFAAIDVLDEAEEEEEDVEKEGDNSEASDDESMPSVLAGVIASLCMAGILADKGILTVTIGN